jgi:hypothetical protein
LDKENVLYTHNGILFSQNKNKILPLAATRMNLEDIMLCEMRQAQKEKSVFRVILMWTLKKLIS